MMPQFSSEFVSGPWVIGKHWVLDIPHECSLLSQPPNRFSREGQSQSTSGTPLSEIIRIY